MKRQEEDYLDKIEKYVLFEKMSVLEIGCGNGSRSIQIAKKCQTLVAIEPNVKNIEMAQKINSASNIEYRLGAAEVLGFENERFDIVFFTLSLHHVQVDKMNEAISEAIRVTKKGGFVIFLEPFFKGSYFESEILFEAGCGDERAAKAFAYYQMLRHKGYVEIAELQDETMFTFDSVQDFIDTFQPKIHLDGVSDFLRAHNFKLNAERRINIFEV